MIDEGLSPLLSIFITIVTLVITVVINTLCLMYVARWMNIPTANLFRCFLAAVAVGVIVNLFSLDFWEVTFVTFLISLVIIPILAVVFIKKIFDTGWGKAILTLILTGILSTVVMTVVEVCFLSCLASRS